MLYSVLDTGNFFVIPASPVDVWAAESYSKTHSKYQLREDLGFSKDDIMVLVVGGSLFYDELSWDYAVAMNDIGPLLIKYARRKDAGAMYRFVFLCGNSTHGYIDHLKVFNFLRTISFPFFDLQVYCEILLLSYVPASSLFIKINEESKR